MIAGNVYGFPIPFRYPKLIDVNRILCKYKPEAWNFIESWTPKENHILKVNDDYVPSNNKTESNIVIGKKVGL